LNRLGTIIINVLPLFLVHFPWSQKLEILTVASLQFRNIEKHNIT